MPGGRACGRLQCPRCLGAIDPQEPVAAPGRDPQTLSNGRVTVTHSRRPAPATPGPEMSLAGIEPAPQAAAAEELAGLRRERDELRRQVADLRSALDESARVIARFAALEQRVADMGTGFVKAVCRVAEIEEENARLRVAKAPHEREAWLSSGAGGGSPTKRRSPF